MGGVNAVKENQYMIEKQIRILENRLEKSLIKYNEAILSNKLSREKIDDLRRERVVFENIYHKMEKELQEKKKLMAEIIEVSNLSYEQRDTYQMEIAAIEQANRKEQEEFEEQMIELGRLLDTELALPPMTRNTKSSQSKLNMSVSERNFGKTASTLNLLDGQEIVIDSTQLERVQNFEEAFNKIKQSTGITDVEELVRTFIKNEDHNFSLFNYVNEQNNEIEKCEEIIQQLREEEKRFMSETGEDVMEHKQILKDMEFKIHSIELMHEKYELKSAELIRIIDLLKIGIQSIFEKLQFKEEAEVVIIESNMVHYLGLIEQNTNQLLEQYAEIKSYLEFTNQPMDFNNIQSSSQSLVNMLGTGPKVPMGQDLIHVNPPKLDDYNSDEDDEEDDDETRPLTLEELKSRTLHRLQKKGQGVSKTSRKKEKK